MEVGAYVGTEANPADVDDLGGEAVELGGTIGKKLLAKLLVGGLLGAVMNAAPAPSVSGEMVIGNDGGTKGLQVGAGFGFGPTIDVEQNQEPVLLIGKQFCNWAMNDKNYGSVRIYSADGNFRTFLGRHSSCYLRLDSRRIGSVHFKELFSF